MPGAGGPRVGVHVYIKVGLGSMYFREARRLAWTTRKVNVLRYGKQKAQPETWLVLYDAETGGHEVARFKGEDIYGYRFEDR